MAALLRRLAILVVCSAGALASAPALAQTFAYTDPGPAGTCNLSGIALNTIFLAFAWSDFAAPPNNVVFDVFVNGTRDPVLSGPIDLPAPSGNDAFIGMTPLTSPPASMPYTIRIAGFPAVNGVTVGTGAVATIECAGGIATVTSLRNGIPVATAAVPLSGTLPLLLGIAIAAATLARRWQRGKLI